MQAGAGAGAQAGCRQAGVQAGSEEEKRTAASFHYESETVSEGQHGVSLGWQQLKGIFSMSGEDFKMLF